MDENKTKTNIWFYIGAGIFVYALGYKAGQKKIIKELKKNWRQLTFTGKDNIPLFYPKKDEQWVHGFFNTIGEQLDELDTIKQIKKGA